MSVGTKIKKLREAKGWSQNTLAEVTGLKRSYISLLEIDAIKSPGAQPIIKLAQAFEVNEDDLFEDAELKVKPTGELDQFVLYLQGKNPSAETIQQLRKIAEALLPDRAEQPPPAVKEKGQVTSVKAKKKKGE